MIKRILAGACIGWAAIVTLTWIMANDRIRLCADRYGPEDPSCLTRTTAARDHVLTSGLTVALVGAVAAAIMWSIVRERNVDRQAVVQPRSIQTEGDGLVTRQTSASPSFIWRARWPRRGNVLAMVLGICFVASLLGWGAMLSFSQRPQCLWRATRHSVKCAADMPVTSMAPLTNVAECGPFELARFDPLPALAQRVAHL